MNPYPTDPEPGSVMEHNRLMNEAVIRYRVPRQNVCPDCYLPTRMCHHLQEADLQCLFHKWPSDK